MSCLFRALSKFVKDQKVDEKILRDSICTYIQETEFLIKEVSDISLFGCPKPTYVSKMRRPQSWGGAIEIQAFCQMFNAKVIVSMPEVMRLPQERKDAQTTVKTKNGALVSFTQANASNEKSTSRQVVFIDATKNENDLEPDVVANLTWNGNHYEAVL